MTARRIASRHTPAANHWGTRRGATAPLGARRPVLQPATSRFMIGQVVHLKSGGQRMTVAYTGGVAFAQGNWLICQWFGADGELQQEMFHEETVELVTGH